MRDSYERIGRSKFLVQHDGSLKQFLGLDICGLREPPKLLAATHETVIGFQIVGMLGRNSLPVALCQVKCQGANDVPGHIILDVEDVDQLPVKTLCPEMSAAGRIDELCSDPNSVAGLAHAALKHIAYAKDPSYLLNIHVLALKGE